MRITGEKQESWPISKIFKKHPLHRMSHFQCVLRGSRILMRDRLNETIFEDCQGQELGKRNRFDFCLFYKLETDFCFCFLPVAIVYLRKSINKVFTFLEHLKYF